MIVKDTQAIWAAMAAERIIMQAQRRAEQTQRKIEAMQQPKRRKPSSKDAWHCDPSEGQRFTDDAQGWIIGGTIVALIAFFVIFAHSLDYWGM